MIKTDEWLIIVLFKIVMDTEITGSFITCIRLTVFSWVVCTKKKNKGFQNTDA